MSTAGLYAFDSTLQTTNIRLGERELAIGRDRRVAWTVLSVVLHNLRTLWHAREDVVPPPEPVEAFRAPR